MQAHKLTQPTLTQKAHCDKICAKGAPVNQKKYNIILIVLMIIIGLVVGTGNGALLFTDQNGNGGGISLPPVDQPTDEEDPQENPNDGQFVVPGPDAGAFERIEFAIKIMEEGSGFTSQFEQQVVAMGQVQKVFSYQYRGEGLDLSEEWHQASGIGQNQFVSSFSDGTNMKTKTITNKSDFSYSDRKYNYSKADEKRNLSVAEYTQKFKPLNSLPITFNQETSSIIKYDKRSDSKNYIIVLRVDPKKIDKEYINSFEANGAKNVTFSSAVYTIKISKTTGYFKTIEKEESFKTTYVGITVSCNAKMMQVFTTMNKSAKDKILEIYQKSFA